MTDFVIKRRKDFVFAIEDAPDQTYTLPTLSGLGFEDAQLLVKIDGEKDLAKRGPLVRDFILRFAPQLADAGVGDMQYLEIYNAYGLFMGREQLGESRASQDS